MSHMPTRRTAIATIAVGGAIGLAGCSTKVSDPQDSSEASSADNTRNIPTITGASNIQLDEFLISINTSINNPKKEPHRRDLHIRIYDKKDKPLDEKTITTVLPAESDAAYPIRIPGDGYNPNDVSSNKIEGALTEENGAPNEEDYKSLTSTSLTKKAESIQLGQAIGTDQDGDEKIDNMEMSFGIPYNYTLKMDEVNFTFVTKGVGVGINSSKSDAVEYRDYENTTPVLESKDETIVIKFQLSEINGLPQLGESQKGMVVAHHQERGSSFTRFTAPPAITGESQMM